MSLGTVLAIPGAFLSFVAAVGPGYSGRETNHVGIVSGYALAVLGVAIGVHVGGSAGDHTGDFGSTMAGALAGGATGLVLIYALPSRNEVNSVGLASAVFAPYVGALVGFYLTRRYETGTGSRSSCMPATTLSLVSGSF